MANPLRGLSGDAAHLKDGADNVKPRAQRFMAERAKAHTVEARASHAVSVSRPDDVADVIEKTARAVR
ncbi:hypothetical protein [Streptomyces sp. NPDC058086]|uniref:hypothetical protein n=1 Tax=Streptomyces sp. NPDC058086 TaxID=3346334 RepID=UPI0036E887E6